MASDSIIEWSSSSSHVKMTYEVFVSFRGDTRNNFTDHLFGALRRKGIHFFKDDTKVEKGKRILPELLQAIEGSRILVVVFSKKYASSKWCLRELVNIAHYIDISGKHVLPVFYNVDPSEVRNQSGNYKKAFDEYEERFKEDKEKMEEVQTWKGALTRVANLSGWDIRNKSQDAEIEKFVQDIIKILGQDIPYHLNDDLVGMESLIEELEKLLLSDMTDVVRVVGICGMPGIGKTTLVTALYERIYHQYDLHCFIDDVSKSFRDSSTLGTQKLLLSQALNEKNLEIHNVYTGTHLVRTRLRYARTLIVLDNVDQIDQLIKLNLNCKCLGAGSRIIIISRDEHILTAYGVDNVYRVKPLNDDNAIQLFCKNAFKENSPIISDYEKLKYDVLSYTEGHPLAIRVLGSFLFGRDVLQWKSALARLKENLDKNIMDVLRISFDGLNEMEKEIFLDIACFFDFDPEEYVKEVLHFRGFHPEIGLKVLVDKSLITITYGFIFMSRLLKDLGRCIVREKSPKKPRNWSRLWDEQDLHKVMLDNMIAENLEAIWVESNNILVTTMRADALSKTRHLKLLKLRGMNFSGRLDYLSNDLRYLFWNQYPFECLPPSFEPDKLVHLLMFESKIKQLWEGTKPLPNLSHLCLSHSKNLIEMPDLREALNLEELDLEGCIQLKKIGPSIGLLRKLTFLNLKDCKSLIKLPHFGGAVNLERLILVGCIQLKQIDPSIGLLRKLSELNLEDCKSLIKLPHFGGAVNLERLILVGCIQLKQIDPSIGLLRKLSVLNLKDCKNLVSLPTSILELNSLEYLSLSGCSKLYSNQLFNEPRDAEHLKKCCMDEAPIHSQSTSSLVKRIFMWLSQRLYSRGHKDSVSYLLPSISSFPCMRELDLGFCNLLQIPIAIGNLRCLERLDLRGNNFTTLPSLRELSKLYYLNLNHCKLFKYLLELPLRTDLPSHLYKRPYFFERSYGYERGGGLYIFNCAKLVEKERCTSMILSWMIQVMQGVHHDRLFPFRFCIPTIKSVVPGSEIPRWFHNQHEGNLISRDTPPHMHDNNWIGIAFCAVLAVHHERGSVSAMGSPERTPIFHVNLCMFFYEDPVTDESDHLCLFYFPRSNFNKNWDSLNSDNSKMEFDMSDNRDMSLEVKKYGYRLVYEKDLQLSDIAMRHSENSSDRKRKFLEIENEQ